MKEGVPYLQQCLNDGLQISSIHTKQDMSLLHVAASTTMMKGEGDEGSMYSEEIVRYILENKLIDVNENSKVVI